MEPGGLARTRTAMFQFSHHEWFYNIRDEIVCFSYPLRNKGTLAVGGVFSSTDIEAWDGENYRDPGFKFTEGYLLLGFGYNANQRFALGATAKILYESAQETKNIGVGVDGGIHYYAGNGLSLGASLRNIGPGLYYETGRYSIPANVQLGVCYSKVKNLNILSDMNIAWDGIPHFHLGGEYYIKNILVLRTGYKTGPQSIAHLGAFSGMTAGFSIIKSPFMIDYAFTPYGQLGLTHRIAVNVELPTLAQPKLKIKVIDGETKMPLESSLYISGLKICEVKTDRLGEYTVKDLKEDGWVMVEAFCEKYSSRRDSIFVLGAGEHSLKLELYKFGLGILHGMVYDAATKKTIAALLKYRGGAVGEIRVDSLVGSYTIKTLPAGDYLMSVAGFDTMYITQTCTLKVMANKISEHDFNLVKRRGRIVLKGVNFETGRAELLEEFYPTLNEVGRILLENPDIVVEIAGHTDPREISTTEYKSNWELSLARADAVRTYIVGKFNVQEERLLTRGYADTQPIAPNTNEEGMAKNRRTEFRILE